MPDEKNLVIKINADSKNFRDEVARIKAETKGLEDNLSSIGKRSAVATTGLLVTIGGLVKSFADFETALVGVGKTADLSGQELTNFGKEIKKLSGDIGIGSNELLGLAQTAGQLGIKGSDNLLKFSATVAKLGTASNLAGEEAATALARIINVTGESIADVDKLASVIVQLGNNSATTEAEIARTATEIAKATNQFKVSSTEAAGFAAALSSIGVQAELGSSVVGKSFRAIDSAVRNGGEELSNLSKLTGLTGEQLRKTFAEDSVEVFRIFIASLGNVAKSGGSITSELEKFGLKGDEVLKVLPTIANNSDLLTKSLSLASNEFKNNTALQNEFLRQTDTLAFITRQVRIGFENFTTTLGEKFRPIAIQVTTAVKNLFDRLNNLSDEQQNNIVKALTFAATFTGLTTIIAGVGLVATKLIATLRILAAGFTATGLAARAAWASATLGLSLVVVGISAFVANLESSRKTLAIVTAAFKFAFNEIRIAINEIKITFFELLNLFDKLAGKFSGLGATIANFTQPFLAPFIAATTLIDNLIEKIGGIQNAVSKLGDFIKNAPLFQPFLSFNENVKEVSQSLDGQVSKYETQVEKIKKVNEGLKQSFSDILSGELAKVSKKEEVKTADGITSTTTATSFSASPKIDQSKLDSAAATEAALRDQEAQFQSERDAIEQQIRDTKAEEEAARKELELTGGEEEFDLEIQTLQERLERLRQQRLQYLTKEEQDREAAGQKILKAEKKREEELLRNKERANKLAIQEATGFANDIIAISANQSKSLFNIGKALALATSVVKIQQGIAEALSLPYPANFVAAALVAARGAITIANISSQKFTGAQDGALVGNTTGGKSGDRFPFMLEQGELVVPRRNFDEVVNSVARTRSGQETGVNNPTEQNVRVEIDIADGAAQFITAKQFENSSLGVDRT